MRLNWSVHSLRFKTTLAITGTLVVLLGASAAIRYLQARDLELSTARSQASLTTSVIEASLEHEMLTNDSVGLSSIVDAVGQRPDIRAIYLVDSNDRVQFASQPAMEGVRLDRQDPTYSACLNVPDPSTQDNITLAPDSGVAVLRDCRLIVNRPDCWGCHVPEERLIGTLVSDFSLTNVNQHIEADLNASLLSAAGTIVVVVLAIQLLLSRIVLGKLERFSPILRQFGKGDLTPRLPLDGSDEIGQLAVSFNQMADGLQGRAQENALLYHALEEKESARAKLLQNVIQAQEEDRKHLSRELHDDFSQSLTALSVTLQSALRTLPPEMHTLRRQLEQLQLLTVDTLGEASRWIQDLRPRLLDDLGLVPAIRTYAETILEQSGTAVEVEANGLKERLPPEIEVTLFRVAQDAVANIAKHAHARHAHIRIDLYETGHLVVRVEDDGIGFIPGKYLHSDDGHRGIGLLSMRERVALLDGTLMIDSTPGRGTVIRAEVPWKGSKT